MASAFVNMFDETLENRISVLADSQGRFDVPFDPTWIAQIETGAFQAGTPVIRKIVHLGSTPPSSNVVFDEIPIISEQQNGLIRLYGDGRIENRFTLLFVAEGYVENRETFTDSNGNGTWEVLSGKTLMAMLVLTREIVTRLTAPRLIGRRDISNTNNEPFTDDNADGFPISMTMHFHRNVRAFLKSLFGSDFWIVTVMHSMRMPF